MYLVLSNCSIKMWKGFELNRLSEPLIETQLIQLFIYYLFIHSFTHQSFLMSTLC